MRRPLDDTVTERLTEPSSFCAIRESYRLGMLIALLKRLAVPGPILGVAAVALIRLKRQRQEKHASKKHQATT
jgi:hypothetical protein